MARKPKTKKRSVSVHANGKPRMRRSGPWDIECRVRQGVLIGVRVPPQQAPHHAYFALKLPTPEHCIGMADWLRQAAKFLKKEQQTRSPAEPGKPRKGSPR
jgi:hypothetical protein